MASSLHLAGGFAFADLYARDGLARLDAAFIDQLKTVDTELHNRLVTARRDPVSLEKKAESELLIALAPHVEDFIAELFGNVSDVRALAAKHHDLAPLYECKRQFVQRRAAKKFKPEDIEEQARQEGQASHQPTKWCSMENSGEFSGSDSIINFELEFARATLALLTDEEKNKDALDEAMRYAAWALYTEAGRAKHKRGVLFHVPKKNDLQHLVAVETELRDGVTVLKLPDAKLRARHGFALTDNGGSLAEALDHANYCIFCHHQGKDSCSKGLKEKDGSFKRSELKVELAGCPLEEKISEMHELKSKGSIIGALAMICVDNPMVAGTGHRICNDCMKACIYQKQEPVNIPMAETRILRDVLELPHGFEIYSLLTRWNPLNLARPLPKPDTGKRVMVAGLGPSGYTLAHHLMNDGHTVASIDGLKIEPLDENISGVTMDGARVPFVPIKHISELEEPLDRRAQAGFGGVAEYGITVRWNKNYLKMIRLLLERRAQFAMFGGVRLGGTVTIDDAFAMGFDHVALCMGAGKPTLIDMENRLARGVRMASDFLMALQLTGAAKENSIANLQLRLPAVVIGGGLTAIDTATEALAYYPVQVEKFLARYEALGEKIRGQWDEEETIIADEFIAHARALREERKKKTSDVLSLLKQWGGVTIAYRRTLTESPSYRLNHEEVEKALEEGIFFAESLSPKGVELDEYGHACALNCIQGDKELRLPARSVLVAAGTEPNTVLAREWPGSVKMHGRYFQLLNEGGAVSPSRTAASHGVGEAGAGDIQENRTAKPSVSRVLVSLNGDGRGVSMFGDLHPSYAGNVVKAMGSAKQGYPAVSALLAKTPGAKDDAFLSSLYRQFIPRVAAVNRLTPTIVEVVMDAPLAAKRFAPGQFFRLQNYEAYVQEVRPGGRMSHQPAERRSMEFSGENSGSNLKTKLAMEGLAMTGAEVDAAQGRISIIALEMGGSSDLCAQLKPGEPVVLMGPTGTPTEIPKNQTVLLIGGGLGNAVLLSIGKALKAVGSRVLYFAGYRQMEDRYKTDAIEAASDAVVWCSDEAPGFTPARAQDKSFTGNIVAAMKAYANGELGDVSIPLQDVAHLIVIGSDKMMAAVAAARRGALSAYLPACHDAVASINSPMQCMMKEICAQCLQKHVDPKTGEEFYVYSCFNQDQKLDEVSFGHLAERLKQNSVQEKLTAEWIDGCLNHDATNARRA